MGVDIWISEQSRRLCLGAKCREFLLTPELVVHWRRKKTVRHKIIAPLKDRPQLMEKFCNAPHIEVQGASSELWAVEYVQITNSNRTTTIFLRFLSQAEYEAQVEKRPFDWATAWAAKGPGGRKAICQICPVRFRDDWDCEPRLFSYSTLPALRNAANELFESPPATLRTIVKQLLVDFLVLFPDSVNSNTAAEEAAFTQGLLGQFEAHGFEIIVPENVVPGLESYEEMADAVINGLFFPTSPDEKPDVWLKEERLLQLLAWINRLFELLMEWNQLQPISEDMKRFADVMLTFRASLQHAVQWNLGLSVSW